ncbi:MAG: sulfur oxidation c-type cytochrome SoxA [Hyphomicrobiaceae bacterium]
MKPPRRLISVIACSVLAVSSALAETPQPKRSGTSFLGPALQAQQRDDDANPAMLWVDQGKALWTKAVGITGRSCAACHGAPDSMKGVATRYPRIDGPTGRLLNLELRINVCRARHQNAEPLAYESAELLALTAFVAKQSRGMPIGVAVDGAARPHYEAGKTFFSTRQGQLNLACSQCHDDNWGRMLRGDAISQGHPTGYPAYRIEWQTVGSLHRRLRACSLGVRAEVLPFGSPEYLDLELYLMARAGGLLLETPAIRK